MGCIRNEISQKRKITPCDVEERLTGRLYRKLR